MNPTLVTRSNVLNLVNHEMSWEYRIYTSPKTFSVVSRKEAFEFIDEHGLVEVFRCPDGQVYDSKDRAFYELYNGFFARKESEEKKNLKEHARIASLKKAERILQKRQEKQTLTQEL